MSALRKAGVWLGLVEEDDERSRTACSTTSSARTTTSRRRGRARSVPRPAGSTTTPARPTVSRARTGTCATATATVTVIASRSTRPGPARPGRRDGRDRLSGRTREPRSAEPTARPTGDRRSDSRAAQPSATRVAEPTAASAPAVRPLRAGRCRLRRHPAAARLRASAPAAERLLRPGREHDQLPDPGQPRPGPAGTAARAGRRQRGHQPPAPDHDAAPDDLQRGPHDRRALPRRLPGDHEPDRDGRAGRQAAGRLRGRAGVRPARQHGAGHQPGVPALAAEHPGERGGQGPHRRGRLLRPG